jgi:hypothetical protein
MGDRAEGDHIRGPWRAEEEASRRRVADAEAIVFDFADRGAPPSFDEETCWYCDTIIAYGVVNPNQHAEYCVWRRAVEWVAQNIEGGG